MVDYSDFALQHIIKDCSQQKLLRYRCCSELGNGHILSGDIQEGNVSYVSCSKPASNETLKQSRFKCNKGGFQDQKLLSREGGINYTSTIHDDGTATLQDFTIGIDVLTGVSTMVHRPRYDYLTTDSTDYCVSTIIKADAK